MLYTFRLMRTESLTILIARKGSLLLEEAMQFGADFGTATTLYAPSQGKQPGWN